MAISIAGKQFNAALFTSLLLIVGSASDGIEGAYYQRLYSGWWRRYRRWLCSIVGPIIGRWWWWCVDSWRWICARRVSGWRYCLACPRCGLLGPLALNLCQLLSILLQQHLEPVQLLADGDEFGLRKLSGSENLQCARNEIILLRVNLACESIDGRT